MLQVQQSLIFGGTALVYLASGSHPLPVLPCFAASDALQFVLASVPSAHRACYVPLLLFFDIDIPHTAAAALAQHHIITMSLRSRQTEMSPEEDSGARLVRPKHAAISCSHFWANALVVTGLSSVVVGVIIFTGERERERERASFFLSFFLSVFLLCCTERVVSYAPMCSAVLLLCFFLLPLLCFFSRPSDEKKSQQSGFTPRSALGPSMVSRFRVGRVRIAPHP